MGLSKEQATAKYCESQKLGMLPSSGTPNIPNPFILIHLPLLQVSYLLGEIRACLRSKVVLIAGDREGLV